MIYLDGNMNLNGIVIVILAIMLIPAILLALIGFLLRRSNKKASKVLYILAVVYVIISLGICGSMMLQ